MLVPTAPLVVGVVLYMGFYLVGFVDERRLGHGVFRSVFWPMPLGFFLWCEVLSHIVGTSAKGLRYSAAALTQGASVLDWASAILSEFVRVQMQERADKDIEATTREVTREAAAGALSPVGLTGALSEINRNGEG